MLRENARDETTSKKSKSQAKKPALGNQGTARRSAGYSQDVRRTCGQRLVQLIPVRRRSYLAAIAISLLIPLVLATFHYLINVSGQLPWYGHPLALTLDASYPRSLAAWLCSQLWLLCLGTTVLTFQLRRHKLDDYNGEYRLWFWLVLTCVLGSIEASTSIISLFAAALNNWSTANLGWSGPAVVKATVAVLVGMLGLRLCSELKSTPASVVFTLAGLVCWGVSAALAQPEFTINMTPQIRIWLGSSGWMIGLTCIWLAGLSYLRDVYIEAQQRFLSRQRALHQKQAAVPFKQRIRDAMPSFGGGQSDASSDASAEGSAKGGSRFGLRMPSAPQWMRRNRGESDSSGADETSATSARRRRENDADKKLSPKQDRAASKDSKPQPVSNNQKTKDESPRPSRSNPGKPSTQSVEQPIDQSDAPEGKRRFSVGGMFRKSDEQKEAAAARREEARAAKAEKAEQRRADKEQKAQERLKDRGDNEEGSDESAGKGGRFSSWLRKPKDGGEAEEYKKVPRKQKSAKKDSQGRKTDDSASDGDSADGEEGGKKSWLKLGMPKVSMPKMKMPSMPSFRLKPPSDDDVGLRKPGDGPKPNTDGNQAQAGSDDDSKQENARPLTKAERKRLRRMQQQNKAA